MIFAVLVLIKSLSLFEKENYPFMQGKTDQELKEHYLGLNEEFYKDTLLTMFQNWLGSVTDLPESFDWREQMPECVFPIRNQKKCGSCWAHSASEFFSDWICIHSKGKTKVIISPQQLVNCDFIDQGCNGGFLTVPFLYYAAFGGVEESCYGPYVSGDTGEKSWFCFLTDWSCKAYRADFFSINIMTNPDVIKEEIMKNGPVQTGFLVYEDFMSYKSGIYQRESDKLMGGHAVKIVGWGQENNINYWIAQNSWAENWGENGYFRIAEGECYFDSFAVSFSPKLENY